MQQMAIRISIGFEGIAVVDLGMKRMDELVKRK
jgi:hypothetical protein